MEMVLKGIIWTVFHLRQLRYISAITSIFGSENIFIKAFFTGFCLTSRELFSRLVEAEVRINKQTTTYLHECVYGIFLSAVDLDFLEEREVRFKPITRPDVFQAIHDLSLAFAPGSWYANRLHGKASTEKPHLYFPAVENSFISAFR